MPVCKKCGCSFPNRITINGKTINLHSRKYCPSCSPIGGKNRKNLSGLPDKRTKTIRNPDGTCTCTKCGKSFDESEFAFQNKSKKKYHSKCKACSREDIRLRRVKRKEDLVELKGGKCQECGYKKNIYALEFHHVDSDEKDFRISECITRDIEIILKEIDKCTLLCSNCHREIHHPEANREP